VEAPAAAEILLGRDGAEVTHTHVFAGCLFCGTIKSQSQIYNSNFYNSNLLEFAF
jgi:hypothetical protein